MLLAASGVNEEAYEMPRARHVLTKALLDALMGTDSPIDILTSATEVMNRVRAEAARQGIRQNPVLLGSIQGGLLIPQLRQELLQFYCSISRRELAELSSLFLAVNHLKQRRNHGDGSGNLFPPFSTQMPVSKRNMELPRG